MVRLVEWGQIIKKEPDVRLRILLLNGGCHPDESTNFSALNYRDSVSGMGMVPVIPHPFQAKLDPEWRASIMRSQPLVAKPHPVLKVHNPSPA